ncbi:MAG: 2-phospho-L-lactate guanylyltransferase, partial [Acidobacteria bacterium]
MINVLIPIKDFARAKQRLQAILSPDERWRLAEAMFSDVLDALLSTFDPECITVVTRDERAIAMAAERHIPVIQESENRGETEAVALAVEALIQRDVQTMLVIPGDIPLITGQDIQEIVEAGRSADVVLVPSRDGRGTNAALLTPPDALPLRFG